MSRAEAARHASLVRWKKESPLAANVQERLAQIRAARLAQGKRGGKGKAKGGKGKAAKPAKPAKQTPEQRKQAQAQQAAANRTATLDKLQSKPNAAAMDALDSLRKGGGIDADMGDALAGETGLVQKHKDGSYSLSPSGKQFLSALDKGDAGAASDAVGRGADASDRAATQEEKRGEREKAKAERAAARTKRAGPQQKKRNQPKPPPVGGLTKGQATAKKDIAMNSLPLILSNMQATIAAVTHEADSALKAGRRNSGSDQAQIDQGYELAMQLCDLFESLGANTGEEEADGEGKDEMGAGEEMGEAEMKAIADDPVAYAQHECGDISSAASALTQIAYLAASEAAEQDEDTASNLAKLRQAMQLLMDFIGVEVGEIKAIGKRDDVNPKAGPGKYGDVQFADAKNKKYPVDTADHVRAAWNYISKPDNAGKYDPDEVASIKKNIVAAWKKLIDKDGPPSAQTATKKALKGIELYQTDGGEDVATLAGYSVKAAGDGWTGGYLVKFGGAGDLSHWRDVFDRTTDYGRATKSDVYVHHRMLPGVGKRRLTNQAEISMDDEGIFIKHLLDLRSSYERKLYGLVEADKLGWSSGTAPHLVERKALGDGRHQIEQWPLGLDASYTPMPAGGFGVEARAGAMKSLFAAAGIDLLNAIYDNPEAHDSDAARPDAVKAADGERARRLLLQLDTLALEATIT